ncbi:MAG: cardiolipin synthase [Bacillus sp. (in: Bacteria)]|nr:cardiolipin synthase [Bacillus sp. (in: firmicutes)]MCM1426030.1 cardiolipin synthase [Eubacterium sp.]
MRKLLQFVLNRVFITALIVLLQVGFFLLEIFQWANHYVEIAIVLRVLSIFIVFYLIWKPNNPAVKLAWIVPILAFPLFGGILYLSFGHVIIPRKLRNSIRLSNELMRNNMPQNEDIMEKLRGENPAVANQSSYLNRYAKTPVWEHTDTVYYPDGLPYWKQMLKDLESAERFIFLEYFILGEGVMWDEVLKILEKKAAQGVEVRLIYDDVGSVFKLPKGYDQYIEQKGIKCVAFNKLIPFMTLILNNRDHRKIVVIDGKIGYTGGINLADEYINYETVYGYWKDAGIRIEGEAVWNFTEMFLQMWNISRQTDNDYSLYRYRFNGEITGNGYVQPYGDTPFDDETVGENVYLNMIGYAKKYFYAFTPYLITDNEMCTALKLAAKRGVDVRIVTPGIPDKKMIYRLTQSNYQNLIEAGVKIYQYTPGFIHSKCVLCDDETAAVGTINFDYRSFYHHFECGVFLYRADAVMELKKDMEDTFVVCEEITLGWCKKQFMRMNVLGPILKLFSPLL